MTKRIFLSYGRDEYLALAVRLKKDLEADGHEVWFDQNRLDPGSDWEREIEQGLGWAAQTPGQGCFVLLMTPHSVRRPDGYCLNEIARALQLGMRIIPVMAAACELPLSICRIQWLEMRDCVAPQGGLLQVLEERYQAKLARLVAAIEQNRLDSEGLQPRLLRLLEPLPFEADIVQQGRRLTGRQWVFDQIQDWLGNPSAARVFWLTGSPGMGKTTIACWLCQQRREVVAFHLCRFGHSQKSDPRRCVLSLAYQLSTQLPEYQELLGAINLENVIPESNAKTLFDDLIVQPLSSYRAESTGPVLVLIDALDEATLGGKNELAAFIASEFEKTPHWLRLLITSRPEPEVRYYLQGFESYLLDTAPENVADIRAYLSHEFTRYALTGDVSVSAIDSIAERSGGSFLYVEYIGQELALGRLTLDRVERFPQGLGGVYARMWERQFPDLNAYEGDVLPTLEAIAAAEEPPETALLAALFGWKEREQVRFLHSVGSLFSLTDDRIQPFHNSLMEWLSHERSAGRYFVSVQEGRRRLADFGWREYQSGAADLSRYTLAHLPIHLSQTKRWDELAAILADPRFLALQRSESFWLRLRGELQQSFRNYNNWPAQLRDCLEASEHSALMLFLGESHDMENRFAQAERIFRRMLSLTDPSNAAAYSTALVRLATVLDHQNNLDEALQVLEPITTPDAAQRYGYNYWWAQYHRGIFMRRLRRYTDAQGVLDCLRREQAGKSMAIAATHQLAVIDLESGHFPEAEEKLSLCIKERSKNEWNHRLAHDYRRRGQVYAFTDRITKAQKDFDQAKAIATRWGDKRYIDLIQADISKLLVAPWLRKERPEKVSLPDLAGRFGIDQDSLGLAFNLLQEAGEGYVVEVFDSEPVQPTGQAVRWEVAHREGTWHASVSVLVADHSGRIALQQRGEQDSHGRWDVSVAGHQDVGEDDISAAARETAEELGIIVSSERLTRIGRPYEFRKIGTPSIAADSHENPTSYRYRTNKMNQERTSVFIIKVSEEEKKRVVTGQRNGAMAVRWDLPSEVAREIATDRELFASSLKQLFDQADVLDRIQRELRRLIHSAD